MVLAVIEPLYRERDDSSVHRARRLRGPRLDHGIRWVVGRIGTGR